MLLWAHSGMLGYRLNWVSMAMGKRRFRAGKPVLGQPIRLDRDPNTLTTLQPAPAAMMPAGSATLSTWDVRVKQGNAYATGSPSLPKERSLR
jgi:hypothetical protein